MKKLWAIALLLLLSACGDTAEEVEPVEIESRMDSALTEMGEQTSLSVQSSEENSDGRHVITLSDNTMAFVEGNKVTMANTASAPTEDINTSFILLVGIVDESLSMGERNQVIQELGLSNPDTNLNNYTKTITHKDIQYTYKGDADSLLLQADMK